MNELTASKWLAKHPKAGEDYGLKDWPRVPGRALLCACVCARMSASASAMRGG
jgi:hypothetical protein